jgi:hypothetical protein
MLWIFSVFRRRGFRSSSRDAEPSIELDNLENLLDGQTDPAQEFLVREKQIDCQRGVELDEHGIFRVADGKLDTQVLFDFPEENFDLPAVFVNIGDCFGRKAEVIGQKFIALAAFRVTVANTAQAQSFALAHDLNDVVGGDAVFPVHGAAFQEFVHGVVFQTGHEENVFFTEQPEPGVADVAFVKDHDGALGQFQSFGHTAFMSASIGNGGKSRDIAVMIKYGVYFWRRPSFDETRPKGKATDTA